MSRNTKKHEVAEKVKEIKKRQENWMKQRAQSQQPESETKTESAIHLVKAKHPASNKEVEHSTRSQPTPHEVIISKKSKAKFQNWLKAKQTNEEVESYSPEEVPYRQSSGYDVNYYNDKTYNKSHYSSNKYVDEPYRDHKGSHDVNILRVPSSRPPEYATPDPGWNSEDETGEITAAELLSADDFDSKADDIIARVRGDLRTQTEKKSLSDRHVNKPSTKFNESSGLEYSNHVCPNCEHLMIPPNFSPMLLIPCGHTLCGKCCRKTAYCGICGCPVQSCTENVMLQQIIADHSKPSQQQMYNKGQKSQFSNTYREEYQNLVTRQEILQEEGSTINKSVQKLSTKFSTEHKQVENILKEEKKIESKIRVLQEQHQELVQHRLEYERNCDQLKNQMQHEKDRLVLVKDSLSSIQGQMEKVRLLAEEGF